MAEQNCNSTYEYINEHLIDKHLKCELCMKPFIDPVTTPCQHTFCSQCIEKYLERSSSCPSSSCDRPLCSNDVKPLPGGLVTQILDALPVKCTLCQETHLTRGHFDQHIDRICPQTVVRCLAADINCPWTGPRDELNKHLATCVFRHLKSMFDELINESQQYKSRIEQLEKQIGHQKTHFDNVQNETVLVNQRHSALEEEVRRLQIDNEKQKTEATISVHQWHTEINTLQREIMNAIELTNQQCRQFEAQIKQLEIENQRQRDEITHANQQHNGELEERIKELRAENQNQKTDVLTFIDQRYTELQTEIRQLQTENESQTDGIGLISQQSRQLEWRVKKLEAENQSQRDEMARANQQHSPSLEERIRELQTDYQNQKAEAITVVDQRCAELQIEIIKLQRENKSQTDGIRLIDQQCRQLALNIKKSEAENQSRGNDPAHVHQQCVQPKESIKEVKDKAESIEMITPSNPKLEKVIAQCQSQSEMNLCELHLTDRDMKIVIKQAISSKRCSELRLDKNQIGPEGASILASALHKNGILKILGLNINCVCDKGVQSLARTLSFNDSGLKELRLNKNDITNTGAHYLAEMLKTNTILTDLYLSENEISDEGVKLLAAALAHHNVTLEWLTLDGNKLMSDSSVDSLVDMLKHNRSLKRLWVFDCNLSDNGRSRLREAVKGKRNFTLWSAKFIS